MDNPFIKIVMFLIVFLPIIAVFIFVLFKFLSIKKKKNVSLLPDIIGLTIFAIIPILFWSYFLHRISNSMGFGGLVILPMNLYVFILSLTSYCFGMSIAKYFRRQLMNSKEKQLLIFKILSCGGLNLVIVYFLVSML